MNTNPWLQIFLFLGLVLVCVKPLGLYMAGIFSDKPFWAQKPLGWLERLLYKACGIQPDREMDWKGYALAFMLFHAVSGFALYLIFRLQAHLPLNPAGMAAVPPDLSVNTAISFLTNTNWQFYGGETTMSYLTSMAGLVVHNFLSPVAGIAVVLALVRGMVRKETTKLGNFWVDMVRGTVYLFLPMAFAFALVLIGQGIPQTFGPPQTAKLLQGTAYDAPVLDASGAPVTDAQGKPKSLSTPLTDQVLALGPVASEISIKQIGTNGGGYYNVNSAHPYENPTPLSGFLEMLAILLIPAALVYTYGVMVGDRRQGWAVLAAMFLLFLPLMYLGVKAEQGGNPAIAKLTAGLDGTAAAPGNWEGKEMRFGIVNSAVWAASSTATSNGSVNSMHDSYTPLGGMVPMALIMLGEVVFGGVGCGLYGMLAFVMLTVFIAGLMVGRTPEYLGKKVQAYEMKMASIIILLPPIVTLIGTALCLVSPLGKSGIFNNGAHGFSEALYAYASMGNNNGSAFAGFGGNTFNDLVGAACMWLGRFWLAVPMLAVAGSLARKKSVPPSAGTLQTHTPLFVVMLVCVVLIVGALTFFPALALGPIVEHLQMVAVR